jgi:hypothetical protein
MHAFVLRELVRRTEEGDSLFDGMPERIRRFNRLYDPRLRDRGGLPF